MLENKGMQGNAFKLFHYSFAGQKHMTVRYQVGFKTARKRNLLVLSMCFCMSTTQLFDVNEVHTRGKRLLAFPILRHLIFLNYINIVIVLFCVF